MMAKKVVMALILVGLVASPAASARRTPSGAASVQGVLANQLTAENARDWHSVYLTFDPVERGGCSYQAFSRSWRNADAGAGITGRKGHRLRFSNIHVWTDNETGSYAFATYDMHVGRVFVGHTGPGQDEFVRRGARWYDKIMDGDYATDCIG
jgi:hypothetical protein